MLTDVLLVPRTQDYQRHLTSQPTDNDDFAPQPDVDKENLPVGETMRGADAADSYRQDFLHGETPSAKPHRNDFLQNFHLCVALY